MTNEESVWVINTHFRSQLLPTHTGLNLKKVMKTSDETCPTKRPTCLLARDLLVE